MAQGKMILLESMMDQDAFAWQADWYRAAGYTMPRIAIRKFGSVRLHNDDLAAVIAAPKYVAGSVLLTP